MHVFIWAKTNTPSNNKLITDLIVKEHVAQGDTVYVLTAEDARLDEEHIQGYQRELSSAQMVYFVFPIEWGSYPYTFKETLDKILVHGYAYGRGEDGRTKGLLTEKRAKIITTSRHKNERYTEQLRAIHYLAKDTVVEYIGMEVTGMLNIGGRHHGDTEPFPEEEVRAFINQ